MKLLFSLAKWMLVLTLLWIYPAVTAAQRAEAAEQPIQVILDANSLVFSTPPVIEKGTTLVQFRPIFEKMGLSIEWNKQMQTIIGRKPGVEIKLQIDQPVAIINGQEVALTVAPKLKNGHTLVPLRVISESVEAKVEWLPNDRTVVIYSKNDYWSSDSKFQFTAYGFWRTMAGVKGISSKVDKNVAAYVSVEKVENLTLALQYFNHTMLFIASEEAKDELLNMTLEQYVDRAKQQAAILSDDIMEEKNITFMNYEAKQLIYKNNDDWDARIDTLIVFKADDEFYSIRSSSYKVTYKSSKREFEAILASMKFQHK
jgi:hypothetical protein